jgi:DNA-binding CsgD family transcriptional regulator
MVGVGLESTLHALRRTILDAQRGLAPPAMLDCAAHMLLYLDEPQAMQRIALEHLLDRFAATRVAIGFGTPYDPKYQVCATQRRTDCDVPDELGVAWPNQHRWIQSIWQSSAAVYLDVQEDQIGRGLRPSLERFRARVKLARRLELDDRSFGIVCVAQTEERRRWGWEDQFYLDQFVLGFLSPLMAESRRSRDKVRGHLTTAEYAIVQLAAQGLSYKEIAAKLNKSPNTVDNQLGRLRRKLGVRNQIALVRACADLPQAE